jgi:Nickel responsive protein SCO4226-like
MPRYLVERTFPEALKIPQNAEGAQACLNVVSENAGEGVTWVHSYFTPDRTKSFCIYDGPNPDSIRKAAQRTKIPVDRITEVRVLDPYFFRVD